MMASDVVGEQLAQHHSIHQHHMKTRPKSCVAASMRRQIQTVTWNAQLHVVAAQRMRKVGSYRKLQPQLQVTTKIGMARKI
jgi:hypothetical protein